MLPGLRFLLAAIVLSMSFLVFGLGAAALLRAAHEEVASIPSRRARPETVFAQPTEAARPTLAMLRVEPPAAEPKVPDDIPPAAAPIEPVAIDVAPPEPERIAALKPDDSSPPEAAKPETHAVESPPQDEVAPAAAEAPPPLPSSEIRIAATQDVLPATNEAPPAAPEQASAPASPEVDLASTRIATLGGPPVTIEPAARAAGTKANSSVVRKRVQARRAKERRTPTPRARQVAAQPDDPFSLQPTAPARSR